LQLEKTNAVTLLRRLEFGVPAELLPLTDLGVELTRGDLLTLWRAGATNNLATMPLVELERLIGAKGRALHHALVNRLRDLTPSVPIISIGYRADQR
jgi:hypothetical protein